MDFGDALTFQFKDPRWARKFLLAALLSLIPIMGQIVVFGWSLAISRQVMNGESDRLPDLDLTNDLLRGLKAWGISIIYALPAILVALPVGIGLRIMVATANGRSDTFWILAGICLVTLLIGYGLVLIFILPAVYANFLAKGEDFLVGMNLKEVVWLLRRSPIAYFLVMIGGFLCVFITLLGLAGCIIGVMFSGLYALTIMAHLYAQAYRTTNY